MCTYVWIAGSQPDWEGEAAASGYHAANYIAYSLHRPEQPSIYIGYNPYNYPMQIEIPAPPNSEYLPSNHQQGNNATPTCLDFSVLVLMQCHDIKDLMACFLCLVGDVVT